MGNEDIIRRLKVLVDNYEELRSELIQLEEQWENEDDPTADPGLQYEKGVQVQNAYEELQNFMMSEGLGEDDILNLNRS